MAKQKGLGRGLDALLGGEESTVEENDGLQMLLVSQLQSGKYQPRSHMDEAALQTLAASIKAQGIMQPILVREIAEDQYEIIAGERIDEFDMTHEKAANAVGRSRVAVSNLLRLLSLADGVQQMLINDKLDMGHARALVGLDAAQQVMLANQILQESLSVREVEKLVKKASQPEKPKTQKTSENRDVLALQETLSEKLGTGITIASKASGAGVMKINYSNLDQLDDIIEKLTR